MKSYTEKYGGWVVLCGISLALLGWFYWYHNRPVGELVVTLVISSDYEANRTSSLATITEQFAKDSLKVKGKKPDYEKNKDGHVVLTYSRLLIGSVRETFPIPGFDKEVLSATIEEGKSSAELLMLSEPAGNLTLINETGSELKILSIISGRVTEKTTQVDKALKADGSLTVSEAYREGKYPEVGANKGAPKTILLLKRAGYRKFKIDIHETPFHIKEFDFEGKEETTVVKIQFNEATILHNTTSFKSFIRDEIKPAVKISVMDETGQWKESDAEGESAKNTTNPTVTLSYRDVPIGSEGKMQVAIEHKFYETFIATNSVPIKDGEPWEVSTVFKHINPIIKIIPDIETKIDGPEGASYPLKISIHPTSQPAKSKKFETKPYQFTLEPFAEYQLIIDGEGIQQVPRTIKAYDPGLVETYPVTVTFEAEKEKKWLELWGDITPEDLAEPKQEEFAAIVEGASINLAGALDQLEDFYGKNQALIMETRFTRRQATIVITHFPPEAPKYKRYIDIEDEKKWAEFEEELKVIKATRDSKKGEERLDKLKAEIEKEYEEVKEKEYTKGRAEYKSFENSEESNHKQKLTQRVDPKGYKEFTAFMPVEEKLKSDPHDFRDKLEKAKSLLDGKYYAALGTELGTYQKTLKELKRDLDNLRKETKTEKQEPNGEELVMAEFFEYEVGNIPKVQLRDRMSGEIRPKCKQLYGRLINAELDIIKQKREVDPEAFNKLNLEREVMTIQGFLKQMKSTVDSLYTEPEAYRELKDLRMSYEGYKKGYLEKTNKKMEEPEADLKEVWRLYQKATEHLPKEAKNFNWGDKLKTEVSLTERKVDSNATVITIPKEADELKIVVQDGKFRVNLDQVSNKVRVAPGQHLVEISYTIKGKKVEYATLMEMEGPAVELNTVKGNHSRPIIIAGKFEPFRRIKVEGMKGTLFGKDNASFLIEIDKDEHYQDLNQVDQVEIDVDGDMLKGSFDPAFKPMLNSLSTKIIFWVKLLSIPKGVTVNKLKSSVGEKYTAHFRQPPGSSEPLKSGPGKIAGDAAEKKSDTENNSPRAGADVGAIISFDPKFGFYVINRGTDHGIKAAQEFDVIRAGKLVGKIKIRQPRPTVSIASAVKEFTPKQLQPGDELAKSD